MSTYNSQTDYELMELMGLRDLKNSQLVLAEIVSVDRVNKTAEITIVEECEALENEPLTDVPFFYHCEYSTGTIEDLEEGHKAFKNGDTVYCIFVPENGDQVKQFYIVGHADIRKTVMCAAKDYLLVRFNYIINSVNYDFVTIYDVESNSKLNLEDFINLDENSPAKPVSLPAPWSSISSWFTYNFILNTTAFNLSGSISCSSTAMSPDIWIDWTTVTHTWITTPYTGNSYNLCSTFNTGNAAREYSDKWEGIIEDYGFVGNDVTVSRRYGAKETGVTKYELGDTYCRAYWNNSQKWDDYEVQGIYKHIILINSKGYSTYVDLIVDWDFDKKISVSQSGSTTEIETSNYSYAWSFTYKTYLDFSVLGRYSDELSLSYSATVNGTLNTPPDWGGSTKNVNVGYSYSSTQSQNAFPTYDSLIDNYGDSLKFTPWYNTMNNITYCCKQGTQYLFILFGGASVETWYQTTVHSINQYVDASVFPSSINGYANTTGSRTFRLVGKSSTSVVQLGDHIPKNTSGQYHLRDCILNTNETLSRGLNAVINELYTFIGAFHNFTSEADMSSLWAEINGGPTATIYDKKFI